MSLKPARQAVNSPSRATRPRSLRPAFGRMRALELAMAIGFSSMMVPAVAQAQSLDLVRAYEQALSYDALVASSNSALEAARERAIQARAGLLPTINNTMGLSRLATESNLSPRREFGSKTFAVNLSYPLYRKQNVETFEQSRLQIAIFEAQFEQARQDLMIRVSQAYFDVLSSQDNLTTIQAQKRAISEQLAAAKRNFEVGTATITDQQEAQARFDLNEAQLLAAENDLAVKRSALGLLTGKPIDKLHMLVKGIALTSPAPARESEWTQAPTTLIFGVMQAQVNTEIAKRGIAKQRFGHYPTVDLVSSVQRSDSATAQLIGVRANTASIGVQFSIPLYAGGAIDSREREAIALQNKALTDLESARRTAEQAVRATFLGVNSGLGQVRALEAAERSSQLALDSNQLGYQDGPGSENQYRCAQCAADSYSPPGAIFAKAQYDAASSNLRELSRRAGTMAEDDMQNLNKLLTSQ